MVIGTCKVVLHLAGSSSLKDKRQVVKSLVSRVRSRFNVSISEINTQDRWQTATLGIACVSNSSQHVDEVIAKVVDFLSSSRLDAELVDYQTEVVWAL